MATPAQETIAGGRHWRVQTQHGIVHIWAPGTQTTPFVDLVVYAHGYGANADSAWTTYRLAEQFAASGRNALFIVPESPSSNGEPVQWTSLDKLLEQVQTTTGLVDPMARATAIAHSGGYRSALYWLRSVRLTGLVLLDALYAGLVSFASWARAAGHRLINVVIRSGKPHANAPELAKVANVTTIVEDNTHFGLITPGTSVITEVLRRSAASLGTLAVVALFVLGVILFH